MYTYYVMLAEGKARVVRLTREEVQAWRSLHGLHVLLLPCSDRTAALQTVETFYANAPTLRPACV